MQSVSLTRRSFIRRATGAAGGVAAFATLGRLPNAAAASQTGGNCSVFGTLLICRTGWGPPSCTQSCKTVYSPNDRYWGAFCCTCTGFCDCQPQYVQVKVTVCNEGGCSAYCVAV
jgi:hypothetical protein